MPFIFWGSIKSNQISILPNLLFHPIFPPNLSPPPPIPFHCSIHHQSRSLQKVQIQSLSRRSIYAILVHHHIFHSIFGMFQILLSSIFPSHLAIFLIFVPSEMLANSSKFYSLNLSALDEYWHRAAVMALLKVRADAKNGKKEMGMCADWVKIRPEVGQKGKGSHFPFNSEKIQSTFGWLANATWPIHLKGQNIYQKCANANFIN